MTPSERRGCDHSEQAAAYVLGALEPVEAERYEEHLRDCTACRDDVARLQPAADALATGVPRLAASEALHGRVMMQVRAEAELLSAAGPDADRPPLWRRLSTRRLALAGATGALACGIAAGALVADLANHTSQQTIQAIVAASAHGARAELRLTGSRADLIVTGMPPPPRGKIYQVWLARAGQSPRPTDALFSVNHSGSASVDVPGNLRRVQRVLVTAEPLGGSLYPTASPVIAATL